MSERLVTVCAECKHASCWQGNFYCAKAKGAGTIQLPISELRAMALEHPSYWKYDKGEDTEIPRDVEDIVWLAEYWQKRDEMRKEPGMFVGYLTEECGVDPALVKSALAECWPEAAALVEA